MGFDIIQGDAIILQPDKRTFIFNCLHEGYNIFGAEFLQPLKQLGMADHADIAFFREEVKTPFQYLTRTDMQRGLGRYRAMETGSDAAWCTHQALLVLADMGRQNARPYR
jgi:hypothetical protein